MAKGPEAFRTISEAADELGTARAALAALKTKRGAVTRAPLLEPI